MSGSKHRTDIDGLRALAVLPVVLFHAGVGGFSGGFVGVDIFFVISGFLITSIILNDIEARKFSIARFYMRRARRIIPALLVVLAATAIVASFVYTPPSLERFGWELAAAATFLSNVFYWNLTDYFAPRAEELVLLHTWSLAVEEQFYLLFPPAVWVIYRLWRRRGLLIAFALAGFASLGVSAWGAYEKPDPTFFLLPTRAWELLIGSVIALRIAPDLGARSASLVSFGGLCAILAAVTLYDTRVPFPGLAALLPCLGAAAIIYAGVSCRETLTARILSVRPFVWIGLISYSLYLWHWPVLVLPALILDRPLSGLEAAVAVTASVGLAALTWRFVEQPFRTKRRHVETVARPLLVSGAALGAIGVVGAVFVTAHGFPGRVPPEVNAALEASSDRLLVESCIAPAVDGGIEDGCGPSKTVFLWGDSHAEHHLPALQEIFGADTVARVGRGDCAPLPGTYSLREPGPSTKVIVVNPRKDAMECHRQNDAVRASLLARADLDLVVISAAWAFVTEGFELGRDDGWFLVENLDDRGEVSRSRALLEEKLRELIEELSRQSIDVLLVGDVPQAERSPSDCLARVRLTGGDPQRCAISAPPALERLAASDALLMELSQTLDVDVFLPSVNLCRGEVCEVQRDGVFIYADGDHITTSASILLSNEIKSAISDRHDNISLN